MSLIKLNRPHRKNILWVAFLLHRTSGIILSLFLPIHFYVLSQALNSPEVLEGFIKWTDLMIVKFFEFGLVFLLAIHFFGGIRLLALEFLPWTSKQKSLVAFAIASSIFISTTFFLSAV